MILFKDEYLRRYQLNNTDRINNNVSMMKKNIINYFKEIWYHNDKDYPVESISIRYFEKTGSELPEN